MNLANGAFFARLNASKTIAAAWGVLAGIGGLVHGIGEVLQGNVRPEGLIINSWTQGPIATNMGGEPGMTILPNLLLTGLLTIVFSLAVTAWSAFFIQRPRSGRVLALLSLGMLLFGGGFGPPIIGLLAAWDASGIHSPLNFWRERLPAGLQRFLAALWPWLLALCFAATFLLVIGSLVLVVFFDVNNADFFSNLFLFVLLSLPPTIVAGFAHDLQGQLSPEAVPA